MSSCFLRAYAQTSGRIQQGTQEKAPGLCISSVALSTLGIRKINCYKRPATKRVWAVLDSDAWDCSKSCHAEARSRRIPWICKTYKQENQVV